MGKRAVSYKFGADSVARYFGMRGENTGKLEEQIRLGVRNEYEEGSEHRRPFLRDWMYNVMFCAGYHWMEWRPTQFSWMLRDRVPSWKKRITENRTLRLREAMAAAIFGRAPQHEVIAGSWDQSDRIKADVCSKALDAEWENSDSAAIFEELVDTMLTAGMCGIDTHWNPDIGPLGPVPKEDKDGNPQSDEFGTPLYEDEEGKPGVPKEGPLGGIESCVVHPWDFIPDPLATKPTEMRRIIRDPWRTMLYIEERWPDKVDKVQEEVACVDPFTALMLNDYYSYRSIGTEGGNDWSRKEPGARVLEMIIKPCKTFSRGAIAHIAGEVVLDFIDELDDDLVHAQDLPGSTGLGIEFMSCYPVLGRFWPIALVDVVAPINKMLDRLVSSLMEVAELHGQPKWMNPRRSNVKSGAFIKGPNEVLEYDYPFKPEVVVPPPMPAYFLKAIDRAPLSMQELAGRHQSSLGQTPTTIRAASAIALVQEQDDVNSMRQVRQAERLLGHWGRRKLGLMRLHYSDQRFRHLVGDETWPEDVGEFKKVDLSGFKDVRIKAGSTLRKNKAGQKAQMSELLSGAVGPALVQLPGEERGATLARLLHSMEVGEIGEVYDKTELHRAVARQENRMLVKGGMPPITPEENPFVHAQIHLDWLLSFPIQGGDQAVLARGRAHYQATLEECLKRMPQEGEGGGAPGGGSKGHAQPHAPSAPKPPAGSRLPSGGQGPGPKMTATGMLPAPKAPAGAPGQAGAPSDQQVQA